MRIAMVCPRSPSGVVGGAERLWDGLVAAINELSDHEASAVNIAAPESTLADVVGSYASFDALDLDDYDMVISGKYPAWMVRHRNHVVHMCHTLRGLYDTYPGHLPTMSRPGTIHGRELVYALESFDAGNDLARARVLELARRLVEQVPGDHPDLAFPGALARHLVHWLDQDALHPDRIVRHLAISQTVAGRDGYFPPGVEVEVAVPPSGLPGLRAGPYTTIFTASRLDGPKRVELIVDAMQYVTGPCELRIAGSGPMEQHLRERTYHDDRITLLGRVDDAQLAAEYANALVVPFVPLAEDLGLITLEAQMCAKPVVTCSDSGGVVDLVVAGSDGFVVEPDARALGEALSRFVHDPSLAREMGERGRRRAREITWPGLIDRLLAPPADDRHSRRRRERVVVLNTYAAEPARHGGQVRVNRLLRALAARYEVHFIAVTERQLGKTGYVCPGLWQTIIEPSIRSREIEAAIAPPLGVPVGDLAALLSAAESPELVELVASAADGAAAVILTHPYLFPAIRQLDASVPVIYDSQNAEWSLKRSIYPDTAVGAAAVVAVGEAEAATMRRSVLITAVSDDDVTALRELTSTLADFVVVPNGVDVETTRFATGADRRQRRADWFGALARSGFASDARDVALFMGSGHPPNVAAATAVLRAARRLPDILFVMVGSHVNEMDGVPTGDNVIARGVVSQTEMQLLLSMCTVALNPMRAGSGTNIKMLDYFAAGAPTITTEIGARGLDVEHGVHVVMANPDELPGAIRSLCDDPARADRLATAARAVALPYDWAELGRQFANHVTDAVAAAGSASNKGAAR